jgi:hypothetical protein
MDDRVERQAGMATRTNAQEERLATLRSVMNVIAILDQSAPRRADQQRGFDLRPLLRQISDHDAEESWDEFRQMLSPRSGDQGNSGTHG